MSQAYAKENVLVQRGTSAARLGLSRLTWQARLKAMRRRSGYSGLSTPSSGSRTYHQSPKKQKKRTDQTQQTSQTQEHKYEVVLAKQKSSASTQPLPFPPSRFHLKTVLKCLDRVLPRCLEGDATVQQAKTAVRLSLCGDPADYHPRRLASEGIFWARRLVETPLDPDTSLETASQTWKPVIVGGYIERGGSRNKWWVHFHFTAYGSPLSRKQAVVVSVNQSRTECVWDVKFELPDAWQKYLDRESLDHCVLQFRQRLLDPDRQDLDAPSWNLLRHLYRQKGGHCTFRRSFLQQASQTTRKAR